MSRIEYVHVAFNNGHNIFEEQRNGLKDLLRSEVCLGDLLHYGLMNLCI